MGQIWPKVVQSGPNWPKMALCPNGSRPNVVQKLSLPTLPSKLCKELLGTPCIGLMNVNHNTNRDFDIPDDEPATNNSELPKTADAVDNLERSN